MKRHLFYIFSTFIVAFLILGVFCINVAAAYVPTAQEKADIFAKVGLAQPPLLPQTESDQIQAICLNAYAKENINDRDTFLANIAKAVQCTACGQLVAYHHIGAFTQPSCDHINEQYGGYIQYGAQSGEANTKAAQYCTNTCLANPNLVPDQAALATGKINVINADTGDYEVVKSGLDNQMGVTCGLPTPGLDGDATVTKCCVPNFNNQDAQAQLVQMREYGCLPKAFSSAIKVGENFLHSQLAGFQAISSLVQGHYKSAILSAAEFVTPGSFLFRSFAGKDKAAGAQFCLSHIVSIVGGKVSESTPIVAVTVGANELRKRACREGALPSIAGVLTADYTNSSCTCAYADMVKTAPGEAPIGENLCTRYLKNSNELPACKDCAATGGIYTGIGCVGTNLPGITKSLVGFGIGLGGGVALLSIFYAAFMIQTSRGNPERIKKGREYLNSALIGLALIIFSVLILQIIGVDILKIPGLGK